MKLKAILNASYGHFEKLAPFMVADNQKLVIDLNCYIESKEFLVSFKNGKLTTKITCGKAFEVPKELLKGGNLEIVVSVYQSDKLAKQWNLEPITIIEHNEGFEGYILIDELLEQNAQLQTQCEELKELGLKWKKVAKDSQNALTLAKTSIEAVKKLIKINEGETK